MLPREGYELVLYLERFKRREGGCCQLALPAVRAPDVRTYVSYRDGSEQWCDARTCISQVAQGQS